MLRRILERVRGRTADPTELGLLADDLPRDDLFTEPLVVQVAALDPQTLERNRRRVRFRVEIKDAEGRRCPDVAVEAEIAGPERTASGLAHTDLLGRARFQMDGPPGHYRLRLVHVAGHALELDDGASQLTAGQRVDPPA